MSSIVCQSVQEFTWDSLEMSHYRLLVHLGGSPSQRPRASGQQRLGLFGSVKGFDEFIPLMHRDSSLCHTGPGNGSSSIHQGHSAGQKAL
ncbi:hypothetical protein PIIN_05323 [Serendipita indica DSM 11827]|uniref:Uncharacterized protein n=1 Tax=Serendipita indica (strain DSM 11827) TaxID=1109443 RepID=G4TJ91_SERID|nr:hypothetical protein PIIN_05323 [Serendipita indica DSM 11827]